MNKINVFIQARMGSKRLPGKILLPLNGKTILEHVLANTRSDKFNPVVLTSTNKLDDEIERFCRKLNVDFFRGSENNVLDRFLSAAKSIGCSQFIRVCSDSPFLTWKIIDRVVSLYDGVSDLASTREINNMSEIVSYNPKGLSVDFIQTASLAELNELNLTEFEREHVIPGFFTRNLRCQAIKMNFQIKPNLVVDTLDEYDKIKSNYFSIKAEVARMERL